MRTYSFDWLLAPFSVNAFAEEVWQKESRLLATHRPGYFNELFGFAEFERVLEYCQPKPPSLRVVSNRTKESVTIPTGLRDRLDLNKLRQYFASGYTLVINNVQNFSPEVANLVQMMQVCTSYPVEANAYLTPPNSQGLHPHYDTHDVLVAQIEGSKAWRIYGADTACPLTQLTDGDPHRRDDLPTPETTILNPGDLLYIPRGWIHEAETKENSALHLTFGIHPSTGRDVLNTAVEHLCRVHPEFRQPMPFGFLRDPAVRAEIGPFFQKLIKLLQTDGSWEEAIRAIEDDFVRLGSGNGDGLFVSSVDALEEVSLDTTLERKPELHVRVVTTDGCVGLQFSQSLLQGPESYRAAMEFMVHRDSQFSVYEIPALEPQAKVGFAKNLLRDGLVRLVAKTKAPST